MGCCMSKCKPKKHSMQDFNNVQEKLAISQPSKLTLTTPIISPSNKISPSPSSPTTSSSSVSSFTCTSNSNTTLSSCFSLSSGSSSILTTKDPSSNEFLWSCVKENPHIIRINSIKKFSELLVPPDVYARNMDSAAPAPKQSFPTQRVYGSSKLQKRVRSNSPAPLNRQKSFRREHERINSSYSVPSRALRSPSPSRRLNGDSGRKILTGTPKESFSKRMVDSKANAAYSSVSSSLRKENLRPMSPYMKSHHLRSCLKNRETSIHRASSKIDGVTVEEALAHTDTDVPMEDIDNPLISLDCFIFL
ncbi:hypothetical protein P3X46_021432 [Hevea brasiliensis]|uniref:Uncharacterized protein n=1 Tax=Hevea brasiliensis TaxID=3981 RepID=A0ABQ9LGU2_HEVBR|nr:uncharacterized protein LOC110649750 [Hevea brasiliensis]KAJ9166725.1 hypothetical protein P3X46_021432 [Hevea brasiliensis]